jgi:hypothetical protein
MWIQGAHGTGGLQQVLIYIFEAYLPLPSPSGPVLSGLNGHLNQKSFNIVKNSEYRILGLIYSGPVLSIFTALSESLKLFECSLVLHQIFWYTTHTEIKGN